MSYRKSVATAAVAAAAMLAACADPTSVPAPSLSGGALLDVGAAAILDARICKVANVAGTFTFDWEVRDALVPPTDAGGAVILAGTSVIDAGDCATIYSIDDAVNQQRFRIQVVERDPGANWALTNITVGPTQPANPGAFIDLASRTARGSLNNDFPVTFTFTNTFTPPAGCTLTQGYWKTHNDSFKGGAPSDPRWANIGAAKELTTFFLSGQTWFAVFNTPPGGNAYYNLAHQYMAAKLNVLGGASAPAAVTNAITAAEALFNTYTPAQIAARRGSDPLRQQFNSLAGILGSYNEGAIGPGHCY